MLIDVIFEKSTYRVIKKLLELTEETYLSPRQIALETGLSVPKVIEILQKLKALKIVESITIKKREKYAIARIHPVKPLLEELLEIGKKFDDYVRENILRHINEVMGFNYYIGMFWAAFADSMPIDYTPKIYAIYTTQKTTLLTLGKIEKVYAEEWKNWKPSVSDEVYIGIIEQKNFPPITFGIIEDVKLRVAEREMGIVQCFTRENKFYPPYASMLALIQNIQEKRISEEKLVKYAKEQKVLEILASVSKYLEERLNRKMFKELTKEVKRVKNKVKEIDVIWGANPEVYMKYKNKIISIDPRPIEDAISTVYG